MIASPSTIPAPAESPAHLPAPPDALYTALCQRDATFEGLFFACVRTTGIFCRPTCTARKPRRENVEFVATAQEALLAGYRPCRICHPLQAPAAAPEWLRDLVAEILGGVASRSAGGESASDAEPLRPPTQTRRPRSEGLPTSPIRERELRDRGLDPDHVRRQFLRHYGMSLAAFQRAVRLGAALRRIREGASPTAAAMEAGYESESGFREAFENLFGNGWPDAPRRGNGWPDAPRRENGWPDAPRRDQSRGATLPLRSSGPPGPLRSSGPPIPLRSSGPPGPLRSSGPPIPLRSSGPPIPLRSGGPPGAPEFLSAAWLSTPLGPMLACASDRGLCLLEFVDRRSLETQIATVRARTGLAIVPERHPLLVQIERELAAYFAGKLDGGQFTVPLDPHGTDFERRVWDRLLEIPYGQTCSYAQMAKDIGRPGAARAIGRANGANRIAIVIPCHRVIRADGALCGYGGGVERKRWLLELEGWAGEPVRKESRAKAQSRKERQLLLGSR